MMQPRPDQEMFSVYSDFSQVSRGMFWSVCLPVANGEATFFVALPIAFLI